MAGQPDYADPSTPVSRLGDASDLQRKVDGLKHSRQQLEQSWKLALAFYRGNQNVFYNRYTRQVEPYSNMAQERSRSRVRLVNNQIIRGVQWQLAMFTKTKAVFAASPATSDAADVKAAKVAEDCFEYWWPWFNMDDVYKEALLWSRIAGNGYIFTDWDNQAGTPIEFMVDPDGNPMVNDALIEGYSAQLRAAGIDPNSKKQTVYLGDIRVQAISPFRVLMDNTVSSHSDAKFCFVAHDLEPDEIKARWGVDYNADSISTDPDGVVPISGSNDDQHLNVKRIWCGYFLPTASLKNGRYVVWGDNEDELLEDRPWTSPNRSLPVTHFGGIRVPGSIYDTSPVIQAIPLQKEFNKTLSQIVEYRTKTLRPQILAPRNSLAQRMTDEAGAIIEYNVGPGGNKPEPIPIPSIPAYVLDQLQFTLQRLNEQFGMTEVAQGTLPPNLEAAQAIDILQEMATDTLAPTIISNEHALAELGRKMLGLAKKYYIEPRMFKITGSNGSSNVKYFKGSDLGGVADISVETGSSFPRLRASRMLHIQQLQAMGVMSVQQAAKYLDLADYKSVTASMQADEDHAEREHERLLNGGVVNAEAAEQAMALVASGAPNPTTNQPFADENEAKMFVMDESLDTTNWENAEFHLEHHTTWMKSKEYEALDSHIKQSMETHVSKTLQKVIQLRMAQPEPIQPPRISIQAHAPLTPGVWGSILEAQHLHIDPEALTQIPYPTIITEQLATPTDGAPGTQDDPLPPNPEGAQAHQQLTHTDNIHSAKMAEHELNIQKKQQDIVNAAQDENRKQEAHNHAMKQQAEKHASTKGK